MKINLSEDWAEVLKDELSSNEFNSLCQFVDEQRKLYPNQIFPKEEEVFRALNLCLIDDVKVVILGQDPYPTRGHAHGLCFSADRSVRPLPRSLRNIYKELKDDLGYEIPIHADLTSWAEQGVLLLNTVLTVREGEAGSHINKGWEQFTDVVLSLISSKKENVVYILWGAKAQSKKELIDNNNNLILESVHPSPLSASRGFFGSKPFSKVNAYLKENNIKEINWEIPFM